jgi:hypothetical protein
MAALIKSQAKPPGSAYPAVVMPAVDADDVDVGGAQALRESMRPQLRAPDRMRHGIPRVKTDKVKFYANAGRPCIFVMMKYLRANISRAEDQHRAYQGRH